MDVRSRLLTGLTGLALSLGISPASAGPCIGQVAALGKTLSRSPGVSPLPTGTLNGSRPDNAQTTEDQPDTPRPVGTFADDHVGSTTGAKEANAAVGNLVAAPSQPMKG